MERGEALIGDWSTMIILSTALQAADVAEALGRLARPALVEDVVEERALARARDAGQAGEDVEREADVEVAEVVLVGVADEEEAARGSRRRLGTGISFSPRM